MDIEELKSFKDFKNTDSVNQYNFSIVEKPLVLSDDCMNRLLEITNLSASNSNEHRVIMFGVENNKGLFLKSPDKSKDYDSGEQSVGYGKGQAHEIMENIINHKSESGEKLIICDIHTHPYGILKKEDGSPSIQNHMIAQEDMKISKIMEGLLTKSAKENNVEVVYISGIVGVGKDNENTTLSIIGFSEKNKRYERFDDIRKILPDGKEVSLKNANGLICVGGRNEKSSQNNTNKPTEETESPEMQ